MLSLALAALALLALYLYGSRSHQYWARRGVPHARPLPFLGTNARRYLQRASLAQLAAELHRAHPEAPYVGFYRGATPELLLRDPELIRRVLVTDFASFHPRGLLPPGAAAAEPLLRNLFFADGDTWRLLRQRMTPAFSAGKLRAMFPLVARRAERLRRHALERASAGPDGGVVLDARELMARYTTEFIGSVGFGLDADCLDDDDCAFRKLGVRIFDVPLPRAIVSLLKNLFPGAFASFKFLGQKLEDDVIGLVDRIRRQRNFEPSGRNDFVDFLLEWQRRGPITVESLESREPDGGPKLVQLEMDDALLAAQAFIFFAAGFETSSSASSFALHQLAYNPAVRRRVQRDVDRALAAHGGTLSYEAVRDMRYLEWTVLEAMRLAPPSAFLMRRCARRYTLPGSDVTLEPGVNVCVSLLALHNDPRFYERPDEFRPERFAPDEVARRHKFAYLPFGAGPRACIGGRMGLLQTMAGLAALLAALDVAPAPGSRRELRLDPRSTIVQNIIGGIPLVFTPRKEVSTEFDEAAE